MAARNNGDEDPKDPDYNGPPVEISERRISERRRKRPQLLVAQSDDEEIDENEWESYDASIFGDAPEARTGINETAGVNSTMVNPRKRPRRQALSKQALSKQVQRMPKETLPPADDEDQEFMKAAMDLFNGVKKTRAEARAQVQEARAQVQEARAQVQEAHAKAEKELADTKEAHKKAIAKYNQNLQKLHESAENTRRELVTTREELVDTRATLAEAYVQTAVAVHNALAPFHCAICEKAIEGERLCCKKGHATCSVCMTDMMLEYSRDPENKVVSCSFVHFPVADGRPQLMCNAWYEDRTLHQVGSDAYRAYLEGKAQQERIEAEAAAQRECCVCYDKFAVTAGVECGAQQDTHFLCDACFDQSCLTASREELHVIRARGGQIMCPMKCGAVYPQALIAAHASAPTYEEVLSARDRMNEQQLLEQFKKDFERRLEEERREKQDDDLRIRESVRHIQENILTLKCPRCEAAFDNFEGCFALTCHRCKCAFCAWCLADCGDDAHAHVSQCPHRLVEGYGGPFALFEQAQRLRRQHMLTEYIETIDEDIRHRVIDACAKELEDLGLQVAM